MSAIRVPVLRGVDAFYLKPELLLSVTSQDTTLEALQIIAYILYCDMKHSSNSSFYSLWVLFSQVSKKVSQSKDCYEWKRDSVQCDAHFIIPKAFHQVYGNPAVY